MKKIDQRQSRQIGGIKTQNKFRNERLDSLEFGAKCLIFACFANSLAIIIMALK